MINFRDAQSDKILKDAKVYLSDEIWNNIPSEKVEKLPYNINGTCIYQLKFDRDNRMLSSKDGRPWKKYYPSVRKGFAGLRRLATCKGSPKCLNTACSYKQQFMSNNRHHFQNGKCKHCQTPAFQVECSARKIWEFDDDHNIVTVYHYGLHSCVAKTQEDPLVTKNMFDYFKSNPKEKPSAASLKAITKAIDDGKDWAEVDKICDNFADSQKVRNIKKKALKELNPFGQSLEAVAIYKKKTDERDPYLIYKINDRNFNGQPSYVFKTGKFKLEILKEMDRNGDSSLSIEYAFIDGNEKRCPGFSTIILSCYHPVLMKQLRLATMECEGENSENIKLFYTILDEALKSIYGGETKFNPVGIMSDEAGAFWKASYHFPKEIRDNSVSCEFHFKQSVNRHADVLSKFFTYNYNDM